MAINYVVSVPPVLTNDRFVLDSWIEMARTMRPVVFIGAGFSLNAVPKRGWREHITPESAISRPKCLLWSELMERLRSEMPPEDRKESDYLRLAQYYRETHGLLRLQSVLRNAVPDHLLDPGVPHLKLTEIRWEAILTMNYDTLIQKAFRSVTGRGDVHVIYRDQDLARPRLPGTTCELIHLHGILEEASSIVLTWDDYRQYAETHPGLLTRVRQLFTQHPVLLMGFSLDDPNFYAINGWVGDLLKRTGRPPVISIQDRPSSDARRAHWRGQGIQIVTLDLSGKEDPISAIGPAYSDLLDYISSKTKESENLDTQVVDPVLTKTYLKQATLSAQSAQEALTTIERSLALLPKTRVTSDTRVDAWYSFSEFVGRAKSQASDDQPTDNLAKGNKTALNVSENTDLIEQTLSQVNDTQTAARWLFIGITNLGIEVEVKHNEYNLFQYLGQTQYRTCLSHAQWTTVLLEQYRHAVERGDQSVAEHLHTEILKRQPTENVRERLRLFTEINHFRNDGPLPVPRTTSSEGRSPQAFNFDGALSLWSNDLRSAQQSYEQARALSRDEHDLLAEWVSLQGLLTVDAADIAAPDASLEEDVRQRKASLEREPVVARVKASFERTYRDSLNTLAAGVDAELLEAKRGGDHRSVRFSNFTNLWNLLLDQEELGLPPGMCRKTAELLGSLMVRQGNNLLLATNLLLRYGSSKLVSLFEIYPPARYLSLQDRRELARLVLRAGRSPDEWVLKLRILPDLLLEFPADMSGNASTFLDDAFNWLEDTLTNTTSSRKSIGRTAEWAVSEYLCKAAYAVARCRLDGLELVKRTIRSSNRSMRRAALVTLQQVAWHEFRQLGLLTSQACDSLGEAIAQSLQFDQTNTFGPSDLHGFLISIEGFLNAVPDDSAARRQLDKPILDIIRNYIAPAKANERPLFFAPVLSLLMQLRSSSSQDYLKEYADLELKHVAVIASPHQWISEVSRLVAAAPVLDNGSLEKILTHAIGIAPSIEGGANDVVNLAYLAHQVLKHGPESLFPLAVELISKTVSKHPKAAEIAASTKRDLLGKGTEELDSFVENLMSGRNVTSTVQPAPWQSGYRKGWTWDQAIVSALRALNRSLTVNQFAPSSWIQGLELLARSPLGVVAHEAIQSLGVGAINERPLLAEHRLLQVLRDGLSHSEPTVQYTAAYWLGRVTPYPLSEQSETATSDKGMSLGILHYYQLGRTEASRKLATTPPSGGSTNSTA